MTIEPIQLEVFKHRFVAIAEEMGVVLRKASFSPNIKERRDFSCALFNADCKMVAQAVHIPVHLGSMPLSVKAAVDSYKTNLKPGDMIMLNDPFMGGTHLPDITLVSPVFSTSIESPTITDLAGFVATRAHHADVGGMSPGSMPIAQEIYQEGLIIPPIKIVETGILKQDVINLLLANFRTPNERLGDLRAQIASNQRGEHRLTEMVNHFGRDIVRGYMDALLAYTETMTRELIQSLPKGEFEFQDFLDNDGISDIPVPIKTTIRIREDSVQVDFSGSAPQQQGSINAVYAITLSAVYYVFRCLLDLDIPNNEGCLAPIEVIAPEGTVVNARHPAPVAGGNVETSQRIVDVLLGALHQAAPGRIPAASQGTMNNITLGNRGGEHPFTYYETIGGGMGALPNGNGTSAIHSHMTNTLNTPVEALEYAYPIQIVRYEIRRGSGGIGRFLGGDGIRRDIQVFENTQVNLLTERRITRPYGVNHGKPGKPGKNCIIREGEIIQLPGKGSYELKPGDILSIQTPGGGGYGKVTQKSKRNMGRAELEKLGSN